MKQGIFTTAELMKAPPTTMSEAVTRVAAIVAIGLTSLGYSSSRGKVKSAAQLTNGQ